MAPPRRGSGEPHGSPTRRGGEGSGGPAGRQRRWDLWIVDRWLPFLSRCRGVRQVRVPSSGRAVPVGLLLGLYAAAPECADSIGLLRVPGADHALGNSVGAIGMISGAWRVRSRRSSGSGASFTPSTISLLRSPVTGGAAGLLRGSASGSYLVDSASSHMLVSKIKPCMSKYKHSCTVKLRMAH